MSALEVVGLIVVCGVSAYAALVALAAITMAIVIRRDKRRDNQLVERPVGEWRLGAIEAWAVALSLFILRPLIGLFGFLFA